MKVKDESTLEKFRRAPRCEWCTRLSPGHLHPHHWRAKGMGGGAQLDLSINLVALCFRCHASHHDGNEPRRAQLLEVIARRELLRKDQIEDAINGVLRRSKRYMDEHKYHPVADVFPRMTPAELAALKEDVLLIGVRTPVWRWNGLIVDGRHRLEVAGELNLDCPIEDLTCDEEEMLGRVRAANLRRRHLNPSQLGVIAAGLAKCYAEAARAKGTANLKHVSDSKNGKNPEDSSGPPMGGPDAGVARAAAETGASKRTTERALSIMDTAPAAVVGLLKDNLVTARDAEAVAKLPTKTQEAAVKLVLAGKVKTLKAAVKKMEADAAAAKALADAEAPEDDAGGEVPEHLKGLFAGNARERMDAALDHVNQARKAFGEARKGCGGFTTTMNSLQVTEYLRTVQKIVADGMPSQVCTGCKGKGCQACTNRGWLCQREARL